MNTTDGNDPEGGQSDQPGLDPVSAKETEGAIGIPLFGSVDALETYCKAYLTEKKPPEGIHLIACMLIGSSSSSDPSDIHARLQSAKQEVDSLLFVQRVLQDMQNMEELFSSWDNATD